MSTQADIAAVYQADKRHPYYSINGGRHPKRLTKKEYRRQWTWGHFALALQRALSNTTRVY